MLKEPLKLVLIEDWSSFEERWFNLSRQRIKELKEEKREFDRHRNQKTGRFEKITQENAQK